MPTPMRHFRCPGEVWTSVSLMAGETGTTVSALILDFLVALTDGTVQPFPHIPKSDEPLAELNMATWLQLRPIIAHLATEAVKKSLKTLENPLPRRAIAKTAGARVPKMPVPRRGVSIPDRTRLAARGQFHKEAGPPVDPKTCRHEAHQRRKLRFGTWCVCGAKQTLSGWMLPGGPVTTVIEGAE